MSAPEFSTSSATGSPAPAPAAQASGPAAAPASGPASASGPPPPPPPASGRPPASAGRSGSLLALLALLVALGAATAAGVLWQRSDTVGREAARRLQAGDARTEQLETQVRQSQETVRELQARSAVLESKLTEALGQQAQLERMYKDMAVESVAAVLGDVESAVGLASQQLLVSGNVRGAIVALQDADDRLQRINQPEALGLRRLIARDIERLSALPAVDVAALALRLDTVAAGLEDLPLVAGLAPVASPDPLAGHEAPEGARFTFEQLASTGRKGWEALLAELSQLFRVNRIDRPDAVLLAPEQQYFVRQNLRLTLLSARLALLGRSEPVFRSDLDRAAGWLRDYFQVEDRRVSGKLAMIEQLRTSAISTELPSLSDTLAAVRSARVARETSTE
ncbi:uroporphyrinogen-III C-methyltransferase [Quisquiliibacterium transsilvanicum]|uniref:uroporphyrinogen-III C-methyltransferase n=1 Tax=Quisquiliibacterium transsilvanicum TaxID=1549638 RepID=UPI00161D6485